MADKKCFKPEVIVTETGGLLLGVDLSALGLPVAIQFQNKQWVIKKEFHVTLVGFAHKLPQIVQAAAKGSAEEAQAKARNILTRASEKPDFNVCLGDTFLQVRRDYRIAQRESTRETIILLCEVEGASLFYKKLHDDFDIAITPPPFHVTLYTLDDPESKKGIGVANEKEMADWATSIAGGELPEQLHF